ncbi:MAG: hypothetical protein QM761_02685 [Pseudoxanthomonas sp.]
MIEQHGEGEAAQRIMRLLFATARGRAYIRANADRSWLLFSKVTAPMRKVEDRQVDGHGELVHARIYWPQTGSDERLPILVYAHGGATCSVASPR